MTRALRAVLPFVLCALSTAFAQDPDKAAVLGDAPSPAPAASPVAVPVEFQAPRPAEELEQMRKWEGEWKTVAAFAKGGVMPEGGEAKGTYKSVRGLGGHAFVGDYKASGTGGDFVGHGVRTWDPVTRKWKTWWYDSWVPGHADVSIGEVGADGTFVTESDSEYKGNKFRTRITERWTDDNKVEQTFESDLGQGWVPVMNITYARRGKWKEKPAPKEKKPRKKDEKSDRPKDDKSTPDEKSKDSKDAKPDKDAKAKKKKDKKSDKPDADKADKADKSDKGDKPDSDGDNADGENED